MEGGEQELTTLLKEFLAADPPTISSAKDLATRMASLARLIREAIRLALKGEDKTGELHQQLTSFQKSVISTLDEDHFADMYAQTISYGLFAARCNAKGSERFTRQHAAYQLPKTNPFLRRMFGHIAGPDLDDRVAWAVDDLAELLHRANISAVLEHFGKRTRRKDPVVHFYETFLAVYDPEMREIRGVYYTPEPVVSYIVRSVDHILKTDFELADGLADSSKITLPPTPDGNKMGSHKVLILDPATGTGTFLHGVIDRILESFKHNRGMWSGYVSQHLLPRLFGFELLMAPYAVAHLKLGLQLSDSGYDFKAEERVRIFLTNSLEEAPQLRADDSPFSHWLFEEAAGATRAKQEAPVMVVLGNPPYSGHSANTGKWIASLLRGVDSSRLDKESSSKTVASNYFQVDGQPLHERNPKWLNNDYVKFIRFAQWRIERTGYGILAFITDNSYLDGITFRGMRQSLMETFDDIYLLDLHGNSNKREHCPDGSKDENVFDIQQGVAISIFVKRENGESKPPVTVRQADLWGLRALYERNVDDEEESLIGGKYYWLVQNELSTTTWTVLEPQSPTYLFVPQNLGLKEEYQNGWKLTEMMPVNAIGMNSHRDDFAIAFDAATLHNRLDDFVSDDASDDELRAKYKLTDTTDFHLSKVRTALRAMKEHDELILRCLYRPFDERFVLYHSDILDRPRSELNRHFVGLENLGVATTRQTREPFAALVVNKVCGQHKIVAKYDGSSIFPLYLYSVGPQFHETPLLENAQSHDNPERRPNLSPEFIADLTARLKLTFIADGKGDCLTRVGPEDVLNYLYAVFYSPTYRSRYAEFLKSDFPRLPLTSNVELFRALRGLGEELVAQHLFERPAASSVIPTYPIEGDNTVDAVRYTETDEDERRVWINKTQYFEGVPPEVWGFHVGGYQICQQWLKDRKGQVLTYDDQSHYRQIVATLARTIELMAEIDEVVSLNGGWPIR